ncbi:MAG: thioesterase domain-containing protein [Rhizomicrobium sp.]
MAPESPLWRLTAKRASAIVPLGGQGNGWPFYCVHSISGDAMSFKSLALELGPARPFFGIQIPKERMNPGFVKSVRSIAEYYVETLSAFQPDGPFVLGGWSAGSFIALEMAQIFQERGRPIPLLVALDGFLYKAGASVSARHPLYYWKLAQNFPYWVADKVTEGWNAQRAASRITQKVKSGVRSIFSLEHDAQPSSGVDQFLDTSRWPPQQAAFVRSLFDVIESYEPKPYTGKVLVYSARSQAFFHPGQVEATWKNIAARIDFVDVDGTHVTMIREPRVARLAVHLRKQLASITRAAEPELTSPQST